MDFSVLGLWNEMGWLARGVVIVLLAMSSYAFAIALERLVTFRKSRERSLAFVRALEPLFARTARLEEAERLPSEWSDAPLARVISVGMGEFSQSQKELGSVTRDNVELELVVRSVERSMERAKKRELAALARGLPVLATIASSAPFVGLLGTVFGIITAFAQMADPGTGGGGLATVSAGVAEALMTTAVGLGVAIIAVWFHNFFATKLEQMNGLIEDASGELTERLLHNGRHQHQELAGREELG